MVIRSFLQKLCLCSVACWLFAKGVSANPIAVDELQAKRVVSMNLCTDQYLLLLGSPDQIQSVSYLSHSRKNAYYYERALDYKSNHGSPEEVVSYNPDLILAGTFSTRIASKLLVDMGYRVELFDHPTSISQIQRQIMRLGSLLGRSVVANDIVVKMKERLKSLTEDQSFNVDPEYSILQYSPGGYTVGNDTLVGEVLKLSGWYNKASDLNIVRSGQLELEEMLILQPLALIDSPLAPDSFSVSESMLSHPVFDKVSSPRYSIKINRLLWVCGGPMIVDAVMEMRKQRKKIEQLERGTYEPS